ncbi:hypothetical protein B0H14DRAFT_2776066 [Mycena olivaceomarginata]|nr:hypothetical protein B0H14DRAFT_2776066 [Mycena olivaceomarginata]
MPHSTGHTAPPTIHDLPVELLDRIIDCVAFQRVKRVRSNLAACALVCRRWTHRSRLNFFRNCRLLLHCHNASEFAKLLRSPCCTILPHVRQLTIMNLGSSSWAPKHAFDDIVDDLRLLVALESLKLSGTSWATHGVAPRRGFMAAFANVVELQISCPSLGDFGHALMILCAFPSLQRLFIYKFSLSDKAKPLSPPYPPYTPPAWIQRNESLIHPPPFSFLRINAPAMIPILHWLNWADSHRHLTRLELLLSEADDGIISAENLPPLQRYLSLCSSLEHLKLVSPSKPPLLNARDLQAVFDLRAFKRLRSLHIEFQHGAALSSVRAVEQCVVPIVQTIASPVFERANFVFEDGALFSEVLWASLDPVFAGFPALEGVCFAGRAIQDLESSIRLWFPKITARGLLDLKPCRVSKD